MEYQISNNIVLTTDSSLSAYGIPALRIKNSPGPDLGPTDWIETGDGRRSAGAVVAVWARQVERTPAECQAARRFLRQMSDSFQQAKGVAL